MEGVLAEIRLFAGNFAPRNWAYCQGQLLSINSNQALFSLLGTTYGGDGRTTFGLPDLRGRTAVGAGHGPGLGNINLGQRSGVEWTYLTANQNAAHTHQVINNVSGITHIPCGDAGDTDTCVGAYPAPKENNAGDDWTTAPNANMGPAAIQFGGSLTALPSGASQAINNRQPFLGMNYVICMQGIFPSRS